MGRFGSRDRRRPIAIGERFVFLVNFTNSNSNSARFVPNVTLQVSKAAGPICVWCRRKLYTSTETGLESHMPQQDPRGVCFRKRGRRRN